MDQEEEDDNGEVHQEESTECYIQQTGGDDNSNNPIDDNNNHNVPEVEDGTQSLANLNDNRAETKVNNGNALQIFCRLRPPTNERTSPNCSQIERKSDSILALIKPDSCIEQQFLFEHVFSGESSQRTMFEQIGKPLIDSLLSHSRDVLLFAYGVTSSGKSYTINGYWNDLGIIPRSIDYLFHLLEPSNLNFDYRFIPDKQNFYLVNQEIPDVDQFEKFDQTIYFSAINRKKYQQTVTEWTKRSQDNYSTAKLASIPPTNKRYSLFVTFVEVYNNYIYDLLERQTGQCIEWKRSTHQIRQDARNTVYVHGAAELEVKNADQAIKLFLYGLQNRRMSQTRLNTNSSRSHSIFTIKLVHYNLNNVGPDGELPPSKLKVNTFSIVDLAGVERTNRTKNTGTKLFEAANINNSLMTLRNCFEVMRKNQSSNRSLPIPYRQNKLTHLFKSFFECGSQIRMIICVKPDVDDFDENLQVLSFGKKAQEIIIESIGNSEENSGDEYNHGTDGQHNSGLNLNSDTGGGVDILEINLTRFKTTNNGENKIVNRSEFLKELEHYLPIYETDLDNIVRSIRKIMDRLNNLLKPFPEKQLERNSLISVKYNPKFSKTNLKLNRLFSDSTVGRRSSLKISKIVNTPIIGSDRLQSNQTKFKASMVIIDEFSRDLQLWEVDSVDCDGKFNSIVKECFRYANNKLFNRHVFGIRKQPSASKMNVFDRLYYNQTPARIKLNQQLAASAATNSAQTGRQQQSSTVTKKFVHSSQKVSQLRKLFTPSVFATSSKPRPLATSTPAKLLKRQPQLPPPAAAPSTITTTANSKTIKMSSKIENLQKKLSKLDFKFSPKYSSTKTNTKIPTAATTIRPCNKVSHHLSNLKYSNLKINPCDTGNNLSQPPGTVSTVKVNKASSNSHESTEESNERLIQKLSLLKRKLFQ